MVNDIKIIIAHELGHLVTQILISQEIDCYKTVEFAIEHNGDPLYPWNGYVKNNLDIIFPNLTREEEYKKVASNIDWFIYDLFSLAAGCVFQVNFENRVLSRNQVLESCFGNELTCLGKGDEGKFNELVSSYLQINENIRGTTKVGLVYSIPNVFYTLMGKHQKFINEINLIVKEIYEFVEKDHNNSTFSFSLTDKCLEELIQKIKNNNGYDDFSNEFYDQVLEIKTQLN